MRLSLPDFGLDLVVSSLLDLQCSLLPAVLSRSHFLRVRSTRRTRKFTLLCTSTQAKIPSQLSLPASSSSWPIFDAADSECPELRSSQSKQTQLQSVRNTRSKLSRLSLQRSVICKSSCAFAVMAGAVSIPGTDKSNCN